MSLLVQRKLVVAVIALILVVSYLFAVRAEALSTQWSSGLPNLCGVGTNSCPQGSGWVSFFGVSAVVTYNAQVVNRDTGAVIACGSTVPTGTNVEYQFIPHVYSDIAWFASGRGFDSPYGDWVAGGGDPPTYPCQGMYSIGRTGGRAGYGTAFGTLSINPPARSVAGLPGGCVTAADGVSKDCELVEPGEVPGVFNFAATYGYMYSALRPEGGKKLEAKYYNKCLGRVIMGTNASAPYRVPVPDKAISCSLTVSGPPPNPEAPSAPTLSAASAVTGAAACTIGTPYTISMSAIDPQGDQIRYGVDWNADGTIDQYVPASGYVPSGTAQTATRLYTLVGTKTVKVLAEDAGGNTSRWATLSFTCSLPGAPGAGGDLSGGGGGGGSGGNDAGASFSTDLTLSALPSLVQKGQTTKLSWSSTNMSTCTVAATNGDTWTALQSILGGQTSTPITIQTVYTLTCLGLDGITKAKSATVNVLPVFQEL